MKQNDFDYMQMLKVNYITPPPFYPKINQQKARC